MDNMSNSPAVVDVLDQDYKSVAIQIPHDSGLAPACSTGDQTQDRCMSSNDSVEQWWTWKFIIDSVNFYLYKSVLQLNYYKIFKLWNLDFLESIKVSVHLRQNSHSGH